MTSELDRSYQMVGRILESLLSSGLRRVRLEAGGFEMNNDGSALFRDALLFLRAEGIIRFTDKEQELDGSPNDAQLTSRGLAAIEDRRFEEGQSVRSRVEKDGRSLSGETYGRIGSFVGGFFGGFTSAVT